jgi:hypothetical protein
MGSTDMNAQSLYHAYAMTYLELERARSDRAPVPPSVLVRLTADQEPLQRAVMRGMRDVERLQPMRAKRELLAVLGRVATSAA